MLAQPFSMISHLLYRLFNWSTSRPGSYAKAMMLACVSLFLRFRYACVRRRLKRVRGHRKLRVVFVIGDDCKWKGQMVYEAMLESRFYDPYIAPTVMDLGWIDDEKQPERLQKCRDFLAGKDNRLLDACDVIEGKAMPRPLREFSPDIVIYQQPWGMAEEQAPIAVSEYALTFYMPYYIAAIGETWNMHGAPLFKILYGHFIENEDFLRYFKSMETKWHVGSTMFPCGCPFREEIWRMAGCREKENCVIYAPHWSFENAEGNGKAGWSTFLTTGEPMLAFAKLHPEIKWIFKPHPMLRIKLEESKVWSKEKIDAYYGEWEKLGEACYSGDYIPLFYRSRAMITDCLSFLSEYLILDRPLIRLEPQKAPFVAPPARKKFDAMYHVNDVTSMLETFDTVLVKNMDPMKETRHKVIHEIGLDRNDISIQIIQTLDKVLGIDVENPFLD